MKSLIWLCGGFLGLAAVVIVLGLLTSGESIVGIQRSGFKDIEYTVLYKNGKVDIFNQDGPSGPVRVHRSEWRKADTGEDQLFLGQTGSGMSDKYIVILDAPMERSKYSTSRSYSPMSMYRMPTETELKEIEKLRRATETK